MRYLPLSLLLITASTMHGMFSLKQMGTIVPRIAASRFASNVQGPLYDTCSCQEWALPDNWNPQDQKEFEIAVLARQFALAKDKLEKSGAYLFHRVDPHMHHNFGPDILLQAIDTFNVESVKWLINEQEFMKGNSRGRYIDSLISKLQDLRAEDKNYLRVRDSRCLDDIRSDLEKAATMLSMVVHAEYGCGGGKLDRPMSNTAKQVRELSLKPAN